MSKTDLPEPAFAQDAESVGFGTPIAQSDIDQLSITVFPDGRCRTGAELSQAVKPSTQTCALPVTG